MKYLSTILIFMLPLFGCAQSVQVPKNEDTLCVKKYDPKLKKDVYSFVDERPEFPGGQGSMLSFIRKNGSLKDVQEPQGSIKFEIVIDVDGAIIDAKISDKEPDDYTALEKEYIRVIRLMPKWKPGKCKNKTVPVRDTTFMHINWSL